MNQGNTPQDMNPEMAKALFCHGAVCLLLAFLREQNSDRIIFGVQLWALMAIQLLVWDLCIFQEQELIVREWDVNSEELRGRQIAEPELEKNMYTGLRNYKNMCELLSCPDEERPRGSLSQAQPAMIAKLVNDDNDLLPHLTPVEGTAPRVLQCAQTNI
ncbi:hypothetical protein EVAR_101628_1 [Eumeta japonica]|uniref:Uncharacterized protein n=1 Tax=Eumeta variegata TaxID=151549 RepID=A0A4C1TFG2_EUMVA|nr:hypothetical protein EVAR_101628_1 [Eumeta japonica]